MGNAYPIKFEVAIVITSISPSTLGTNGGVDIEINGKGFGKDGKELEIQLKMGSDRHDCNIHCYLKDCGPTRTYCRSPVLVDGSAELEASINGSTYTYPHVITVGIGSDPIVNTLSFQKASVKGGQKLSIA
uniref:IPT/TIG domain-containing protein n=1 Tax=Clytia hemisphaerica TaxID=252671 RepID=A0A7M5VEE0_9CNID